MSTSIAPVSAAASLLTALGTAQRDRSVFIKAEHRPMSNTVHIVCYDINRKDDPTARVDLVSRANPVSTDGNPLSAAQIVDYCRKLTIYLFSKTASCTFEQALGLLQTYCVDETIRASMDFKVDTLARRPRLNRPAPASMIGVPFPVGSI